MPSCLACGASNATDARLCSGCGVSLTAPVRKTVTVLHSDLRGFTPLGERLDAESLLGIMDRYFTGMADVIERHGGTVEKFSGDAIQAAFGYPTLHEDDALRAARCVLEMRAALTALNQELRSRGDVTLHARYGLSTGEVAIARVGKQDPYLAGDAVNVAQRLETAAPADGVLVSAQTERLLRDVARLAPLEPLQLKGKSAPTRAWQLLELLPPAGLAAGTPTGRMVGRRRELGILRAALDEAIAHRECRLVTVLGPAGIGKSCLVRSFMSDAEERATVVLGRCLSYGKGITFWPLAEIVEQLAGQAGIAALVGDDEEGRRVSECLARAVGLAPGSVPIEEIRWALRRLFEEVAGRGPLMLVVEDVHWAEPTLLELLAHVAREARDAPLLLVCLARPESFSWEHKVPGAASVDLGPLTERQCLRLLGRLDPDVEVSGDERARLLATAEGNPFFLEQMVAMKRETGADAGVPHTIQAVLDARIDALPQGERAVIDCAAIVGRQFHRSAVAELLPRGQRRVLDRALESLLARDMIRAGRADLLGDDGYRFSHILVSEAIYANLSKAKRADLHERFGRWLAERAVTDREYGEIIGFHLEQAHRWLTDLQPHGGADDRRALAQDGARHLATAGRAAVGREDLRAGANLLKRAAALLDDDDPERGRLLPELGAALTDLGALKDAKRILCTAVERASARGEAVREAHARVCLLLAQLQDETGTAAEEVLDRFRALRASFEAHDDALGLDRLWRLRALVYWLEARSLPADRAWRIAVRHALRAGDEHGRTDALRWLASSALAGPTTRLRGIARCEDILEAVRGNRPAEAFVLGPLAALRAMGGEFAAAHELLARSSEMLPDLGVTLHTAVPYHQAVVALLEDDPAAAEASLRAGYEELQKMGEKALHAETATMLARAIAAQDRLDDAFALTVEAEAETDPGDISARVGWRTVRASILLRRREPAEAEPLATGAVRLLERSDWLIDQADALSTLGEVLAARGEPAAAGRKLAAALALHEKKGNVVAAGRVRTLLAQHAPA
jgi:class 3 adenylate cyclase